MDELTAKLVLFSELGEESILSQLASVYRDWKQGAMSRAALAQRVHPRSSVCWIWRPSMALMRISGRII